MIDDVLIGYNKYNNTIIHYVESQLNIYHWCNIIIIYLLNRGHVEKLKTIHTKHWIVLSMIPFLLNKIKNKMCCIDHIKHYISYFNRMSSRRPPLNSDIAHD